VQDVNEHTGLEVRREAAVRDVNVVQTTKRDADGAWNRIRTEFVGVDVDDLAPCDDLIVLEST